MNLNEEIEKILIDIDYKIEVINDLMYLFIEKNSDLYKVLLTLKNASFEILIDCFAVTLMDSNGYVIYYHLISYKYNQSICVYINVINKIIQSIINIFSNANWYEREIYEMYNINFTGHKNIKKLFNNE